MQNRIISLTSLALIVLFSACKHDPQDWGDHPDPADTVESGYPLALKEVFVNRCATAGCHNAASYQNAGGLRLDTWENLFKGGGNGSVVVPYAHYNSSLLYFINTDEAFGPVAEPTMPLNQPHLTADEYQMIASWVASGAPDKDGQVAFSGNAATRQKIYMTMQGCDQIAVVDAATNLIMRYIPIGMDPLRVESAHRVGFSPDGKYAYVCFQGSNALQKIDAEKDTIIGQVDLGVTSEVFMISPDGKSMVVSSLASNRLVTVDLENMMVTGYIQGSGIAQPHGIQASEDFSTLYVTGQTGNVVYKIRPWNSWIKMVSLDGLPPSTGQSSMDPHEIIMTPDFKRYFVTCEKSNEVRVMDAEADTLIKVIPMGIKPQELAISSTKPYIFVTVMEDVSSNPNYKGSVYIINYDTYQTTRIDGPFFQPHGITVDDQNGKFYVLSRNFDSDGPAPHHSSSCDGRNGYYHVYDLNTLERLPVRHEATVDPYSADTRFK